MAKNLREKLALVLEDTETVSKETRLNRLVRVYLDELELLEAEHAFSPQDMNHVNSLAGSEYAELYPTKENLGYIASDPSMIRTLCMIKGVVGMLRHKGLIKFTVKYRKE